MSAEPDMNSVLGHVSQLEAKNKLLEELLNEHKLKLDKYTEATQNKMKETLQSAIQNWIKDIDVKDEKVVTEFLGGMEKLVKDTKEDSGVWQVMCCASKAHIQNVNRLNEITEKYNELQTKLDGGSFRAEESRVHKRKLEEEPKSAWDEFESMMRGGNVASYVPDPEVVKGLRSEWKPL